MVKYSFASGGLSGSLQLSAGEVSTNNKSAGGLVKYASGPSPSWVPTWRD